MMTDSSPSLPLRYYVVHARTRNVDLLKDLGCMPHVLATEYGYETKIVTYENDDFEWRDQIPGAKLVFIRKRLGEVADTICYLLRHAGEIDVLHIEHLHRNRSLVFGVVYKLMNPTGLLYYKLDASPQIMEALVDRPNDFKSRIKTRFLRWMLRERIDLASVEATKFYERLTAHFSDLPGKFMHLPNGYQRAAGGAEVPGKQNIIFTAGRLGARQKATEILLEAFAKVSDPGDWKLVLAGAVEEGFQKEIDRLFERHPDLRARVEFAGYVTDRGKLEELYGAARIFCFPSRWEGFSHAVIEAAYFANYIVATDVGGVADAIAVTGYGKIIPFDDPEALAETLQDTIRRWGEIERPTTEIQALVTESLSWGAQCGRLHERLTALLQTRMEGG